MIEELSFLCVFFEFDYIRTLEMSSANNARNLRIEIKRKVEDISDNIIDLTDVKQARKFEQTVIDLREVAEEVHNVRELSLVTHGLKDLSKAVKAQAGSLSKLASKLDFETLARGLKNQFEGQSASSLDWEKYGSHMFSIYDSTCKVTTLRGPLLLEVKARRERQPRASQDASDPAKATVVTQEEDGDDEATSERVYNLLHALDEVPKPDGATFDLLSLLVNPKNPVKTIENLFDFAFIVKVSSASVVCAVFPC